jgi:hypothetical protein
MRFGGQEDPPKVETVDIPTGLDGDVGLDMPVGMEAASPWCIIEGLAFQGK